MASSRRLISIRFSLDTDESIHHIRMKWLLEIENPENADLPYQREVNQILSVPEGDLTTGEQTSLAAIMTNLADALERKHPLVVVDLPE